MRIFQLFSDPLSFLLGLLYRLPAVLIALSFHEWGHAYAAYRLGDPTARNLGRMSVDPIKHIDIIGFICMIVIGFGWAKPVPINIRNFKKPRRDDILVSVAGVSMNFILANVGIIIFCILLKIGVVSGIAYSFINQFVVLNISLMIFNLLPIPPLDGYHVLKDILIRKVNPGFFWNYERFGSYILLVFIFTGATASILTFAVNGILDNLNNVYAFIFGL